MLVARILLIALLVGVAVAAVRPLEEERETAIRSLPRVDILSRGGDGDPRVLFGDLGSVSQLTPEAVQRWINANRALFRLGSREVFKLRRVNHDERTKTSHFYFDQFIGALPVFHGELFVHVKPSGQVFGITSNLLSEKDLNIFQRPRISPVTAIQTAAKFLNILTYSHVDDITLQLAIDPVTDEGHLAFVATISTRDSENAALKGEEQPVRIFASVFDGSLIVAQHQFVSAINRTVWTANNLDTLPGTLVRTETGPVSNDQVVDQAFNNAGVCYDFYFKKFGRDSWNGKGAPLNSTVHYKKDYNNAFWNGNQMVYGDGDGINFTDFAGDLTVVCHELTHAVTSSTADLTYWYESGALNEAMSDIFGASINIWNNDPKNEGLTAGSWLIGAECYLAGEALRYMYNPPLDGQSRDYYPDRYKGLLDNRGVHINSGIANLAYVLLVQGGVHPNQKTTNWVPPAGIIPSQNVFYTALTQYMTKSTNFADARSITEAVSNSLYNNPQLTYSVSSAWAAVGVGSVPPPVAPAPK